jgi:hypothetical protein
LNVFKVKNKLIIIGGIDVPFRWEKTYSFLTINGLTAVKSESCMLVHVQASGQEITLLNIPKGGNRDLMHTLISDLTNRSRNIVLKTSGSGNDFYISIENYTTVQKTCDKFALLLYGNGNGSPICSLITVNVSGSNVQIDGTSNIISSNVYCRASGTSIQICNLPQWGYYTVIAPPRVYIDQGGIVFDN